MAHTVGVKSEHFLYVRFDTTHPRFTIRLQSAENQSKQTAPNNIFSVVFSDDGLEAVIKIIGANPTWKANKSWTDSSISTNGVLDIYTKDDHHRLATLLLQDPNWSNTRGEEDSK